MWESPDGRSGAPSPQRGMIKYDIVLLMNLTYEAPPWNE